MPWLFLLAYWCSGFAGLIYEVCWTRLLTLYVGHTTAAASAVVGAFLGGLATGAAGGGQLSAGRSRLQSLYAYTALEIGVAGAAFVLPYEARLLMPVLRAAYANGDSGFVFSWIRLASCFLMVFIPATALGATFPFAIRWFATDVDTAAKRTGVLYAVNTAGAAVGALLAGFILIPSLGLTTTIHIGIASTIVAALSVGGIVLMTRSVAAVSAAASASSAPQNRRTRPAKKPEARMVVTPATPYWLPASVLGVSGFAALTHEIAWTRLLSLILGPTIYAFSATVAVVIAGVAVGSAIGTWISGRAQDRVVWLAGALVIGALFNSWTASLAGTTVPHLVASYMARSTTGFDQMLRQGTMLAAALILPSAVAFGAVFPLSLSLVRASARASSAFGSIYAINTIGAVGGSLLCGFVFIRAFGLHATLGIVSGCLIVAAMLVVVVGRASLVTRGTTLLGAAVALLILLVGPPWDRGLLASGAYLYAPYVPKDLDLDTQLKAGTLLYDRDGAAATVSVKRLTGTLTLAVDGKVDASNRSDMLTQKLLAHLPLLLHNQPRDIAVVGLGSGVTVGAALRHPVARVDIIEISPEVVEASHFFDAENQHALSDPRSRLIVGDGRSHLLLGTRQYDVIISEPSNPWIAGVAALFTREFFQAARARLAPGGVICQWAHTYNIADGDLRSIVGTFMSVFPNGTLWLIGEDDVLLVASNGEPNDVQMRLQNLERNWQRPGVAADLASVAALEPFSVTSLLAAGPGQLVGYAVSARILTDDRMTLEFDGPRALHSSSAEENSATLGALTMNQSSPNEPGTVGADESIATADNWRRRAAMLFKADAYSAAYRDYQRALTVDITSKAALEGFVRSAILAGRATEAIAWIKGQASTRPVSAGQLVAISKLQSSNGLGVDALDTAKQATRLFPADIEALEQLASVLADADDSVHLEEAVGRLESAAPARASTLYFSAVSALMHGRVDEAVSLGERSIAADSTYAPVYDLVGAAYTKRDRPADARKAFERSLQLDAHDSTAYTNLGLLELAAGNRQTAANDFAEALGLAPGNETAREGLARTR